MSDKELSELNSPPNYVAPFTVSAEHWGSRNPSLTSGKINNFSRHYLLRNPGQKQFASCVWACVFLSRNCSWYEFVIGGLKLQYQYCTNGYTHLVGLMTDWIKLINIYGQFPSSWLLFRHQVKLWTLIIWVHWRFLNPGVGENIIWPKHLLRACYVTLGDTSGIPSEVFCATSCVVSPRDILNVGNLDLRNMVRNVRGILVPQSCCQQNLEIFQVLGFHWDGKVSFGLWCSAEDRGATLLTAYRTTRRWKPKDHSKHFH